MFKKKIASNGSVEENALSAKEDKKGRFLILFSVLVVLLVGFFIGKISMNGQYENAKEAGKNAVNVVKGLSEKNTELQNEAKRLQTLLVERGNKETQLANAFETAISIQEAIGIINSKAESVKSNAQRIRNSYINGNSEVRNLDSNVIRELLSVVDNDTNKQLSILEQAIKTLNDYQKNKNIKIQGQKQEDLSSGIIEDTQKEPVIIKETNSKVEIEPLDFGKSVH